MQCYNSTANSIRTILDKRLTSGEYWISSNGTLTVSEEIIMNYKIERFMKMDDWADIIDFTKKHCFNCMYFEAACKWSCRKHEKNVMASDEPCLDFKDKIFTKYTIDNWETVIRNNEDDEEYGVNGVVYKLNEQYYQLNELYMFRLMYNALLFNSWYKHDTFEVYKSQKHSDGEPCFDGDWFIVVAILPSGQITNHYHIKYWDLFKIPIYDKVKDDFDGHTSDVVLNRLLEVIHNG